MTALSLFWNLAAQRSAEHLARHEDAVLWRARLSVPCGLAWVAQDSDDPRRADAEAVALALSDGFEGATFPLDAVVQDLQICRDALGKPYVTWQGDIARWAAENSFDWQHLHISNTHDGNVSLVVAIYSEALVGLGIDAVSLPRLRLPGKDVPYLHRFARQFMSEAEWDTFLEDAAEEDAEALRVRVAAHFSLMEAASKACGTGLKIGAGMGRPTSLPKRSIGVKQLAPPTRLLFTEEAERRLDMLGATNVEAHWSADNDFLISVVCCWKA